MPSVELPDEVHDKVKDYAQRNGLSVIEAYIELLERGLSGTD